jgi:hypothetical protein
MEHASIVLSQQRAAGEAPPHVPAHVCLLMHVGAEQANTRLQERERVSPAKLVRDGCDMMLRDGCDMMPAHPIYFVYLGGGCSTRIYVDSGRYRGLVSLCCGSDGPLGCCMPLVLMRRLSGDRVRGTLRRKSLHFEN